MRNSNTNNWRSTALIAGAILTAGVVTTTSTTNAHADDSQNNAQVSSNLSTYDQVRATADSQLAQLQSANDSKEAQQATANEQTNAEDLARVNAQIDQLNAEHAALLQKQAGAIAQAQAETNSSIEEQTAAANAEYQQQINAQQQNEATQQAANDQQYAQAVSQNEGKQQVVNGIHAQYQKAISDAANTAADQKQAATNDYNDAVAKENSDYQGRVSAQNATNDENINNAQVELGIATSKAQQSHTVNVPSQKTVSGRVAQSIANVEVQSYAKADTPTIPLEVSAYNDQIPYDAYEHPEFAMLYFGEYTDSAVITNGSEASTPHDINEMPLTFKPGLLTYNAQEDHSEEVPASGLTASQVQILRALVNSWANGFRNEVFTNYRDFYNTINSKNGFKNAAPLTLVSTDVADRVADQVADARTRYNVDNNTHSNTASGIPADQVYSARLNDATKGIFQKLNGHKTFNTVLSENLTTMAAGKKRTLLNYAVNLYNSMQGMYYAELVNQGAIGGHAYNILRGDIRISAVGFQKLSDSIVNSGNNKGIANGNPLYAVTFDNVGYNVNNNVAETNDMAKDSEWGTSTIDNQLNAIKYAQNHAETVYTESQVQPTAEDVNQATMGEQQKLAYAKDQAQQALDSLAKDHQANLAKLEQQFNAAKDQIQANYDQAVATAKSVREDALKENGLVDLQAYKAKLDAAYQNLVKADKAAAQKLATNRDAKIKNIKATENAKLAAKIEELAPSVQPQIKKLMEQHQAVVAHGDAVLSEMRAANKAAYAKLEQQFNTQLAQIQQREAAKNQNKVQLANATVVLPSQSTNANNAVRTVANPSVVQTASQASVTATPVVATTNQAATATPTVTANTKATKADNSKKSASPKKADQPTATKQTTKKEATKKVNQSSMSIVALATTALVGAAGLSYSTKKRHN